MDIKLRIEQALEDAVSAGESPSAPAGLSAAIRYAVFPAGHRIRPRIALGVARACGDDRPGLSGGAAAAIELLHCASLVHDDLPAFDDASTRRGKPSVHRAFGEPLAVLTGDALIVMAFETLARAAAESPDRLGTLVATLGRAVGTPSGICAGQAWECETNVDLSAYQRAKTGALFAGAAAAGAGAAGHNDPAWLDFGAGLGEAYQVADDICDLTADPEQIGKPTGQDRAHARPNAAHTLGIDGAKKWMAELVQRTIDSIPDVPGRDGLRDMVLAEGGKILPKGLVRAA
ncbi:MAG: polyprenyl synthetase family protein [Thalassobaculaceae bacterium]